MMSRALSMLCSVLSKRNCSSVASVRALSETEKSCKLLIIGGGSGGCSIAAKFAPKLSKSIIVVEPSDTHYYQPMFTLIGGGMKTINESCKPMSDVIPKDVKWIKDSVCKIEPQENYVVTKEAVRINYEFLVVAAGLMLDYHKIPGLVEALETPNSGVCSNYSPRYVQSTYKELQNFTSGNLVFTFPNTPVKCAGAPQKIVYIADHFLRKHGKRSQAKLIYNTSLGVIFGVEKYANALWQVCEDRDITVNLRTNLVSVDHAMKTALFEELDRPGTQVSIPYSLLHVTPPMSPPPFLRLAPMLTDHAGWLDLDKRTLRHKFFNNVFGIGDCTNLPTSKTAAAVAAQSGVLYDNLSLAMLEQPPASSYDGYTSCPLVTSYDKCILAEFDYELQPLETFPIDQGKERRLMFLLKRDLMPALYWKAMLTGLWRGPATLRKIFSFGGHFKKT